MTASTTPAPVTRVTKGRDGWEARTKIDMGAANRVLIIHTHKTTGGVVVSNMVNTDIGDGLLQWDCFGDYNKRVMHKGVRCTEKTIRDLHAQALSVSDATLADARAFYAPKPVFTPEAIASMAGTPTIDAASAEYHARADAGLAVAQSYARGVLDVVAARVG